MKRSIGVTFSAGLALAGSIFWIVVSLFAIAITVWTPSLKHAKDAWVVLTPLWIFAAVSLFGVATSVGLFRLKNWARISTLIFSIALLFVGIGGLIGALLQPPGTQRVHSQATMFFLSLSALATSSWWIYLFNKSSVKSQFVPVPVEESAPPETGRPLSVTFIALLFLFGAVQPLFYIGRGWPQTLLGLTVTGWAATAVALASAAIHLYCGIGLFRLQELVRKVAMGYLIYGVVSALLFIILPGAEGRFAESLAQLPPGIQAPKISLLRMSLFGLVILVVPNAVQIWCLATRRRAFQKSNLQTEGINFER